MRYYLYFILSMENSFVFNESFTNGFKIEFLDISTFISIVSGILVITSKNPIVSVLCLIGLFLSIASYLIILGVNFIGLSYLLVYVGAVSILFLFILMLINVRISELLTDTSSSILLALLVGIYFNYTVYTALPFSIITSSSNNIINTFLFRDLINNIDKSGDHIINETFVTSNSWDGNLLDSGHITTIGNVMYTSYSIWLIITSIILLLAMVGAIVITIKQKN